MAALGWTATVLVGLWMPPPPVIIPNVWLDKVTHAGMFAGVGGLWQWVATRTNTQPRQSWAVLGGSVALGALTEVGQGVLPWGRTADPADLAFDALGAVIGVVAGVYIRPPWREPKRLTPPT